VQEWDDIISAQRDDLYSRRSEILLASDQDCVRIFKGFCDATVRDIVLAQTVNGEIKVDKISSLVGFITRLVVWCDLPSTCTGITILS
jgi:preprotein translocase subunit SecA